MRGKISAEKGRIRKAKFGGSLEGFKTFGKGIQATGRGFSKFADTIEKHAPKQKKKDPWDLGF